VFWPNFYCGCAETVCFSELVTILTLAPLDKIHQPRFPKREYLAIRRRCQGFMVVHIILKNLPYFYFRSIWPDISLWTGIRVGAFSPLRWFY